MMTYRVLFILIAVLLVVITGVTFAFFGWWAAIPALLAIGWLTPVMHKIP